MVSKPKLADPGALIRGAKLRTRTERICVDPDLVGEYEELLERQTDAVAAAARDASPSMASPNGQAAGAEFGPALAELLEAMEASILEVTFTALSRSRFRALKDKHPPRKDAEDKPTHPRDSVIGAAYEPFFDELLRVSIVSPVIEPELLDELLDEKLSDAQWEQLTTAVWNLNRTTVDVPFSPAVSPTTRRSSRR